MRQQKTLHGLSRRPHKHVHFSFRFIQVARLDGLCARPCARIRHELYGARDLCARPSLPHVSAGHTVRTQHGCGVTARAGADVTTSAGQRRGDVEMCVCCLLVLNSVTSTPQWIRQPEAAWGIRNYLREQAGSRTLVFDFSVTLERCGSSGHPGVQNGLPTQDLDAPLRIAAQRKINSY